MNSPKDSEATIATLFVAVKDLDVSGSVRLPDADLTPLLDALQQSGGVLSRPILLYRGTHRVKDGHLRVKALKQLYGDEHLVPCREE